MSYIRVIKPILESEDRFQIPGPLFNTQCWDYLRSEDSVDITTRLDIISQTTSWTA